MSKKSDMIVVGVVSAALFTGFTSYSYFADKATAKANFKQAPLVAVVAGVTQEKAQQTVATVKPAAPTPKPTTVQAPTDQPQTPPPAPNKKNTRSKAS